MAGWLLGPLYAALASGIGSALADLAAGYPLYIPATFVIKAGMALLAAILCRKTHSPLRRILSALLAEATMVLGYFLYEWVLYGIGGKKPIYHTVFHVFVDLGSILQAVCIIFYIL